ncbi:MAG: class I SAM-dependent methyltransferase [Myxococcota bacterium]
MPRTDEDGDHWFDDVDAGAHEHYRDAELYDYEYRRRRSDIRFYRTLAGELAGPNGPVLELACGSGRVTLALARAGLRVVAFDRSRSMLERASERVGRLGRAARSRVTLLCADMRQFALGRRFPLAIMAFNSFEHLYTRVEVEVCLARIREHLEPDGLLVFDVQNPDPRWLARDSRKRWGRTVFTHPGTGHRMVYTTNHEYDPISQIALIRLYYDAATAQPGRGEDIRSPLASPPSSSVVRLSQRKFFPAELEALLSSNGFAVVERYGDFDGGPLWGDCPVQIVICRARARTGPPY